MKTKTRALFGVFCASLASCSSGSDGPASTPGMGAVSGTGGAHTGAIGQPTADAAVVGGGTASGTGGAHTGAIGGPAPADAADTAGTPTCQWRQVDSHDISGATQGPPGSEPIFAVRENAQGQPKCEMARAGFVTWAGGAIVSAGDWLTTDPTQAGDADFNSGWRLGATDTLMVGATWPLSQSDTCLRYIGDVARPLAVRGDGATWNGLKLADDNLAFGRGLAAMWASADGALVLAAGSRDVARLQGGDWVKESLPAVPGNWYVTDLWGLSASSVYAVGGDRDHGTSGTGVVYHFDGAVWSAPSVDLPELAGKGWRLDSVWARSASEIYFAGAVWQLEGTTWMPRWLLLVHDGTTWKVLPAPPSTTPPLGILALRGDATHLYVSTIDDIWVYDGSAWAAECTGKAVAGFTAGTSGEILAYGPFGVFLRP